MNSPLIKNSPSEIIETIETSIICKLYREKLGVDVQSFFKGLENIEIRKCTVSGYRYYYPHEIAGDAQFYNELSRVMPYYSRRHWQYNQAKQVIKKGDKVLDIGCGSGFFLEEIKAITANLHGLEFNPKAVEECKRKNIEIHSSDLKDLSKLYGEEFDVITFFQVLEHVPDFHSFIENSIKLLKPNGKLVIAVPNNNPYIYKYDKYDTLNLPPHHVGLWEKSTLSYLSQIFNISTLNISIEPMDNFPRWLRVQSKQLLGFNVFPNIKIINKSLRALEKLFAIKVDGRNIVAIYKKNDF